MTALAAVLRSWQLYVTASFLVLADIQRHAVKGAVVHSHRKVGACSSQGRQG